MRSSLILFLLLQTITTASLSAQPRLGVAGGTKLSLGRVYEGRAIRREFLLRNSGKDTLLIDSVRTSCGCTFAEPSTRRLGPGGEARLAVTFDTKDITGKFTRQIFIGSNDPVSPRTVLSCDMTILPVIRVEPRYISFGRLELGVVERRTIRLRNALRVPVRILKCTSPDSQISLSLSRHLLPPGEAANLAVTLRSARAGKLLGQFELRTDTPLKPLLRISYVGRIKKR